MVAVTHAILLATFMVSLTIIFVTLVAKTQTGVTKSLIVTLLIAKVWTGIFYLMGIDKPVVIIRTKLGDATITAMMLLFLTTLITNIYFITRIEKIQKILG